MLQDYEFSMMFCMNIFLTGSDSDDVWLGMTNYDRVECESSGECHQHLMWIDGTRFNKNVLGGSNPSFEVEDDEKCIRYKLDDFSAEVSGSGCTSSRKFVCQFECTNPLSKYI